MKILHMVSGELSGGAARGAYWLHRGLLDLGVDTVLMTSGRLFSLDKTVVSLAKTQAQRAKSKLIAQLGGLPLHLYSNRKRWPFSTGFEGINFTRHPEYKKADLVHLHWINGLVAMRTLRKVKKPIVWTLRDMWPMTGGCHYAVADDCHRYITGCGRCPQLDSSCEWDLSRLIVKNKCASFQKGMHIVGISRWLSDCARSSKVFNGFSVETISNNIDTQRFYPEDPLIARKVLGLPVDKKIVLIGSQSIDDFYKGFDLLVNAINLLNREDVHFVSFGRGFLSNSKMIERSHTSLGFLSDIISLRLVYSAADVFVAPSRMEAFGKTLAEAMACGTPVVCFDATGPADVVEHKVTGYKAKPFDVADLCEGIHWVLSSGSDEYRVLCLKARERVVLNFDSLVIARQYLKLYQKLLS